MEITLRPTPKQHQAWQKLWDAVTKYLFFGGGAGGGKSWVGCEWLVTNCQRYPGSKWFLGREELSRLMKSTYITFTKVCKHHGISKDDWKLNGQYNYIEFTNGSRIDLLDLKYLPGDPLYERFGSLEYTGGWIEEGGEIEFKAFDTLKSRVGRHMNDEYGLIGKILVTCNPKKNWLYQDIYKPWKEGTLPAGYAFIQSLYNDNPYTADSYAQDLAAIKDQSTKQRLMFGNWEYDNDPNALMEYDAIVDLFTNTVEESADRYMTVDVARLGEDKTIIRLWQGLANIKTWVFTKQTTDVTEQKIKDLAAQYKVPYSRIIVDEDGIGGGVVDHLKGVKGFTANSTPLPGKNAAVEKPNYANLKAQCSYLLADYVNHHRMAVRLDVEGQAPEEVRQQLIEELEAIKAKDPDSDKKLAIEPKDKVKELLGRSPDHADTLVMRMYFELRPAVSVAYVPPQVSIVKPYYPSMGI